MNSAGSPKQGEPVFLAIGQLRRSHGLKGEIIMEVFTDFPERISTGKTVYCGNAYAPLILQSVRPHGKFILLSFKEYDSIDDIRSLTNQILYVKKSELPKLPNGQYYHHEILGLEIVDENGEKLGILTEIILTGANEVYVVKNEEQKEILLPAIKSVILEINLSEKYIKVKQPQWV